MLGVEQFHLVGHSLGGIVGTLVLELSAPRVVSFANLDGNLVRSDCGASASVVAESRQDFERQGFATFVAKIAASPEKGADQRVAALNRTTARTFYDTADAIVRWSSSPELLTMFVNSPVRGASWSATTTNIRQGCYRGSYRVTWSPIPDISCCWRIRRASSMLIVDWFNSLSR